MVTPVSKTQVYEAVYDSMVDLIEDGTWKAGDRIPGEITLAKDFQVSRNSLRTAIKVLDSNNILTCKPGVGTFVADNALGEIRSRRLVNMMQDTTYAKEIVEVRSILDKEIAYQSALKCSEQDVAALEDCIAHLSDAAEEENLEGVIFWGSRFHEIIVEITGNQVLITIYKSLKTELDHDRLWYLQKRGIQEVYREYIEEDRKIIQAFQNHDGELARDLMVRHMDIRIHGIAEIAQEKETDTSKEC